MENRTRSSQIARIRSIDFRRRHQSSVQRPRVRHLVSITAILTAALAGCGSSTRPASASWTNSGSSSTALSSAAAVTVPAWQAGSPEPQLSNAQWQMAGISLDQAWIGDADQRLGALANTRGPGGERFGRCMAERLRIHDATREYALLVAYKLHSHQAEVAVGSATGTCVGMKVAHDPSFAVSLSKIP